MFLIKLALLVAVASPIYAQSVQRVAKCDTIKLKDKKCSIKLPNVKASALAYRISAVCGNMQISTILLSSLNAQNELVGIQQLSMAADGETLNSEMHLILPPGGSVRIMPRNGPTGVKADPVCFFTVSFRAPN